MLRRLHVSLTMMLCTAALGACAPAGEEEPSVDGDSALAGASLENGVYESSNGTLVVREDGLVFKSKRLRVTHNHHPYNPTERDVDCESSLSVIDAAKNKFRAGSQCGGVEVRVEAGGVFVGSYGPYAKRPSGQPAGEFRAVGGQYARLTLSPGSNGEQLNVEVSLGSYRQAIAHRMADRRLPAEVYGMDLDGCEVWFELRRRSGARFIVMYPSTARPWQNCESVLGVRSRGDRDNWVSTLRPEVL